LDGASSRQEDYGCGSNMTGAMVSIGKCACCGEEQFVPEGIMKGLEQMARDNPDYYFMVTGIDDGAQITIQPAEVAKEILKEMGVLK
jgi:hypothetical protein